MDEAVLNKLGRDVLRSAVVEAVLAGVLEAMSPHTIASDTHGLRTQLLALEREVDRLTQAIIAGGELASLLEALKVRHARRDEIAAAIAARDAVDVDYFDRKAIETEAREHMKAWRALLTKHVHDGRQLLREVLSGPLRFMPEGRTYHFESEAAFGCLLMGTAGLTTNLVAVRGIEPRFDG